MKNETPDIYGGKWESPWVVKRGLHGPSTSFLDQRRSCYTRERITIVNIASPQVSIIVNFTTHWK